MEVCLLEKLKINKLVGEVQNFSAECISEQCFIFFLIQYEPKQEKKCTICVLSKV